MKGKFRRRKDTSTDTSTKNQKGTGENKFVDAFLNHKIVTYPDGTPCRTLMEVVEAAGKGTALKIKGGKTGEDE